MTDIVNGLLLRGQEVLLAKRSATRRKYPGSWSFPGGHVEADETLDMALIRELSEELGILATSWLFIERFEDAETDPLIPVTFHFFVVDEWQGEPRNIGKEHTQIRLEGLDAAMKMPNLTFPQYVDLFERLKVFRLPGQA